MPTSYVAPPFTTLLQRSPRMAVASFATVVSFAVIGAVNTASFVINKTADLVAWAVNDRRDESWAPFLMAVFILISLARLLWMKLLQDQPANSTNIGFTPEQLKKALESFTRIQQASAPTSFSNAPKKLPTTAAKAFLSESDFAKNLKRAGTNLFAQPASSSTRPADLDDALLNAAFEEMQTQNLSTRK